MKVSVNLLALRASMVGAALPPPILNGYLLINPLRREYWENTEMFYHWDCGPLDVNVFASFKNRPVALALADVPMNPWRGQRATLLAALALLLSCAPPLPADGTTPTQVRLSWSGSPRTSMTVVWQTAQPTESSSVQYGTTAKMRKRAVGNRVTYPYETGVIHEVSIQGLKPGTTYFYRVGDKKGGFSEISSFRTEPVGEKDFVFTAFGDHGVGEASKANVDLVLADKPAFHLILGDLSYANGYQKTWDEWFEQLQPLSCVVPIMPTLGNHENERIEEERIGYMAYLARLALPARETYYSFDYCGARFVSFNSDDFNNPEQMSWFIDTLKKAREDKNVRWLIVYQHHPLYSSNVRRLNNLPLIEAMRQIYDEYKVDLVLAGHNHNYERSYPLVGETVAQSGPGPYEKGNGVVFVISGGGGKSLYQFIPEPPAITARRESVPHYLRVMVSKNQLLVEAIRTADRSTLDSYTIQSPN